MPDDQPNPVLVGPGLKALKNEAYTEATNATPSLEGMSSEAPSYFDNLPGADAVTADPSETKPQPVQTAGRASSGTDLLRRLSLKSDSPMSPEADPRVQHPGLRLSGRVISAAFCIPYKLNFRSGSDWVRGAHSVYLGDRIG